MTDMPDFDPPLLAFCERLRQAEFSDDEIAEAAAALGGFTGEAFNLIQAHIHSMVDKMGMTASEAFASEVMDDDWYKGFLSGIVVSTQVVLYGEEHIEEVIKSGIIEQLRKGMDALLEDDPDLLPPDVAVLIKAIKDGDNPSEEVVRAATRAWMAT